MPTFFMRALETSTRCVTVEVENFWLVNMVVPATPSSAAKASHKPLKFVLMVFSSSTSLPCGIAFGWRSQRPVGPIVGDVIS